MTTIKNGEINGKTYEFLDRPVLGGEYEVVEVGAVMVTVLFKSDSFVDASEYFDNLLEGL